MRGEDRPASGEERPGAGRDARAGARGGDPGDLAHTASKAPLDEPPGGMFPSWRGLYLTLLAYTGLAVLVLFVLTQLMNAG